MVTTRGQSGSTHTIAVQSSHVVEDVSRISLSKKRQRIDLMDDNSSPFDEPIATPTKKKQKKITTSNKNEEHFERHSHLEVVIPVKEIAKESTEVLTSSSRWKSTGKQGPTSNSPLEAAQSENEGEDLPGVDGTASNVIEEHIEDDKVPRSTDKKPAVVGRKRMSNSLSKRAQRRVEEFPRAVDGSKAVAPKHKRFGSEDLVVEEVSDLVPTTEVDTSVDEDRDSDDDAPEVVEKDDAQERARTAARIASKAAEEQNAVTRKKRKERDSQLKEQAKSAKKNTKASNNDEERISPASVDFMNEDEDSNTLLMSEALNTTTEPLSDAHANTSQDGPPSKAKSLISKSNLPEFLPAEYLEDSPVKLNHSPFSDKPTLSIKPKKTKFVEPAPQKPRDRIKDGVIYRVSEARGDPLLAPKVVNSAKSVKEAWLRGRIGKRGGGARVEGSRKVPNKGFFVNKR